MARNDPSPRLSAFVTPIDVAIDSSRKVYVLDAEDQQIHLLSSGGTPLPAVRLPAGSDAFPTTVDIGPDDRLYLVSSNRKRPRGDLSPTSHKCPNGSKKPP